MVISFKKNLDITDTITWNWNPAGQANLLTGCFYVVMISWCSKSKKITLTTAPRRFPINTTSMV